MEQLLKILWAQLENSFFEGPIYSSFVSGRLFMLRHFILFTVISKFISFDIESIYHSAHSPISLFPHFSHWHSAKFIRVRFSSSFPFQLHCGDSKDTESPLLSSVHTSTFSLTPTRPRVYKSWRLILRICLIIGSTALRHKSASGWFIGEYQLDCLESKKASMVDPHGCWILFPKLFQ